MDAYENSKNLTHFIHIMSYFIRIPITFRPNYLKGVWTSESLIYFSICHSLSRNWNVIRRCAEYEMDVAIIGTYKLYMNNGKREDFAYTKCNDDQPHR
jgi:hypothetical protein